MTSGALVRVQELDRVFDRDDVRRGFLIAMIDHRGEGRRLAGAGGADHQDESAPQHGQFLELRRHSEFVEVWQFVGNVPEHHRNIAALVENVDTESPEAGLGDREIDFQFLVEVFELLVIHELDCRLLDHLRRHLELVDRHDLALDLDLGRRVRCEEKVRRLLLDHQFE
jgi:hypothetical protein